MDVTAAAAQGKLDAFITWFYNPVTMMLMLPLIGCLLIMAIPRNQERAIKFVGVLFAGLTTLISIMMLTGAGALAQTKMFAQFLPFSPNDPGNWQFFQKYNWMQIRLGEFQSFGVDWEIGVDGLSMPLILLTTFVTLLCLIWALPRTERVRDFFALTLFMETGLLGSFVALDYVLLYLFWEWMLIPMYFLIAGWGKDKVKAAKAAMKFFIYTLFGSVFMLIAFIAMQAFAFGTVHTFSIPEMQSFWIFQLSEAMQGGGSSLQTVRLLMFIGLMLGFVIKAPMFPFHTWLPDAHSEAPTEMSVILAAVMLKTGTYAMLRMLYPSFPDIAYITGPIIAACGLLAIVYGAAVTLVQVDLKRMVAYSSISHMGFIILGISALNMDATIGTIYHMVGHGIIITALFFLVGYIEQRYGTRNLHELCGMLKGSRPYALALGVAAFASMGFPGLAGFWGEFLVLKGTFFNNPKWVEVSVGSMEAARFLQIAAIVAVIGILASGVYMLSMLQRVLPGEAPPPPADWRRLRLNEALVLTPVVLLIVLFGVYPQWIITFSSQWAGYLQSIYLRY